MTKKWKKRLYVIIFEAETPAGKAFDVALLIAILLSILAVMLESVEELRQMYGYELYVTEWFFTILFTIEYILRLASAPDPMRYARSGLGLVDLLSILPTYISVIFPGAQSLLIIRTIRLLRVFRIFKLSRYLGEGKYLVEALHASKQKIIVFLLGVLTAIVIFGTMMYLVEGSDNGFNSIPRSIYWAIVTLTTVGYGDIAPQTILGQALASVIMLLGYGILAVPTGIVTVEMNRIRDNRKTRYKEKCKKCGLDEHDIDAIFCKNCGNKLDD